MTLPYGPDATEAGWHNLRDLGGLPTGDGRRVKPGRLIRSGELCSLSPAGAAHLRSLDLGVIVDFRSADERETSPTIAAELADVPRWELKRGESLGDPAPILRRCLVSIELSREAMAEVYRKMAFDHRESYRALILAAGEGRPLLFHCAAGKDRTGVGAALLLALLGVEREAIKADYLLSEQEIDRNVAIFLARPVGAVARDAPLAVWRPMMAADPAYLGAMFDEIDTTWGSLEAYARDVLELPEGTQERLREVLLE